MASKKLGNLIKEARTEAGLTQEQLARKIAVLSVWGNHTVERANFMYLATSTEGDSLANLLPQNMALRLVLYAAAMLLFFGIVYLPVHLEKKRNARKEQIV